MYGSCSGMRILYYADTTIYSKNAKSSDGREADMNLLSQMFSEITIMPKTTLYTIMIMA